MATVVFDFDSTLITCESLEEILKSKNLNAEQVLRLTEITGQGMSGEISFLSSLEQRLDLASVSKKDFKAFGESAWKFLTPGMHELVQDLMNRSVQVWVISGALREVLLPIGKKIGIPEKQLLGIDLIWNDEGRYTGIDASKPINRSKWEGVREDAQGWSKPRIAIGDSITDYSLYEHGAVDHFIAFTQYVRRKAVLDKGVPEAKTVEELREIINEFIYGKSPSA